jgi:hypothetical protein
MPEPDPIRLDELRARLRETQEAAQRLADEGWAGADAPPRVQAETADEISALVAVLRALRDAVPEDLWEEVREIVRQLLLLLRALLDLVVERIGPAPGGRGPAHGGAGRGPVAQDIPIA